MKIQLGDLVHFRIKAADIVLQEGFGIIMKKADPDLVHMDKHSRELAESWIVYAEDRFWFVRETYFVKIYKPSNL